jgi:hypothetical protein
MAPQVEMWRDAEVGLAEVNEGGDNGDRVRRQVHQLDAVEVEEAAQEVSQRDAETSLDVREEDDGLSSPLCRELLARRPAPPDLELGPQQPAVC